MLEQFMFQTKRRVVEDHQAAQTARKADRTDLRTDELEQRIEKLTVASMALFSLLKDHHGVTEDQFLERVKEIDLLDGVLDGKLEQMTPVSKCPSCKRIMSRRHQHCLYCGEAGLTEETYQAFR